MVYSVVMPLAWLVWRIVFRIEFIGRENLIKGRGFIIAPNHRSAIDPVFVVVSSWYFFTHRMRIFAKRELYEKNALLSWFLTSVGCVAVKRGKDDLDTLNTTVAECRQGRGLLLFPEGTRSHTRELLPIKSGAFVVAGSAGVDLIPCRILYDTPDGGMKLFCRVRVCYGEPIAAEKISMGEERDMKKLRAGKALLADAWKQLAQQYAFAEQKENAE